MSAVGTVGLSTDITADLSTTDKVVILFLMTAGPAGILAFAIATAMPERARAVNEDDDELLL